VVSKGESYAGLIGISLVYGMRVTGMLNWVVRSTTELSTQMNCVERILFYVSNVKSEEGLGRAVPSEPPEVRAALRGGGGGGG
jgi:ATP-binding cassette subfamily C (CFTR/MRP) protein 1